MKKTGRALLGIVGGLVGIVGVFYLMVLVTAWI